MLHDSLPRKPLTLNNVITRKKITTTLRFFFFNVLIN